RSPSMRAIGASSSRTLMYTSPVMCPLITACGTRTSPSTSPCSLRVNMASSPSASTVPSMRPSRCKAPLKRKSPRITVPRAIRLVSELPRLRSLRLRLSISVSLGGGDVAGQGGAPRHGAAEGLAAGRIDADAQPCRPEIRGQHDRALQLLEIGEAERQAVLLRAVAQRRPVQRHDLVLAHALHADRGMAVDLGAALGVLGQAEDQRPAARTGDRLQLHLLQLEALALIVAGDQARIEPEVRTQRTQLLLALRESAAQGAGGHLVDLASALQVRHLLLEIVDLCQQRTLLLVVDYCRRAAHAQHMHRRAHRQQAGQPRQTPPQAAPAMADVVVPAHHETRRWS